jgi:hypothetical protein
LSTERLGLSIAVALVRKNSEISQAEREGYSTGLYPQLADANVAFVDSQSL